MKIIHKSDILEATEFDPLLSPWPEGIVKVTREDSKGTAVSFEFVDPVRAKNNKAKIVTTIKAGDVITTEFDPDTLEMLRQVVLSKELIADEFIILGEVEPQ